MTASQHAAGPPNANLRVRILATTDVHMHLLPFDYHTDRPAPGTGLAAAGALLGELRRGCTNTLLFDNGDFLQGTPLADYVARDPERPPRAPHPAISAMNALGFDAGTLGNHDFDYGISYLRKALREARFPVVSANLVTRAEGAPLFAPHTILKRVFEDGAGQPHTIRVGVIGFAPPPLITWGNPALREKLDVRDIVETARQVIPRLRAAGADLVIALAHTGIGAASHAPGMENAAVPLGRVAGIDAILAGHTHQVFPSPAFEDHAQVDVASGTVGGTPATMSGFRGSHVGVIDLSLQHRDGKWRVAGSAVRAHATPARADGPPDVVASCAATDHAATRRVMTRRIGSTETPLHSYFALLGIAPATTLVLDAQRALVAEALAGTDAAELPVLSAAAPFKAGGLAGPRNFTDIAAGPLLERALHDLYPYPNTLCALRVTGRELRAWLERAAGVFRQIPVGATDAVLLDPGRPTYTFDFIAGIRYEIDPTHPALYFPDGTPTGADRGRISALTHAGHPVRDDDLFVVAASSFRASGGGNLLDVGPDRILWQSCRMLRDLLRTRIRDETPLAPGHEPAWSFAPLQGTSVLFDTGPGAAAYLDAIAHLAPECVASEPAVEDARRFLRLRLHL